MKQFALSKIALSSIVFATGIAISIPDPSPASAEKLDRKVIISKPNTTTLIAQADPASIERAVFNQINQYRQGQGLSPLAWDNTISNQARIHSQNMANGTVPFSHNGFAQRVQEIAKVISYRGAAENVAYNRGYSDPATKAVQGWLNSSGHLRNIKGNYNLTGVGIARNAQGEYYFTQIFIRK